MMSHVQPIDQMQPITHYTTAGASNKRNQERLKSPLQQQWDKAIEQQAKQLEREHQKEMQKFGGAGHRGQPRLLNAVQID